MKRWLKFPCRQYIFEFWQSNSTTTENWDSNGHKLCFFRRESLLLCLWIWFYCTIGECKPGGFSLLVLRYCMLHRWLFGIDNKLFSNYLYVSQIDDHDLHGIYPDFLTLNCEQESREQVSFLDVLIFRDENIWCTKTFDKREHLPLSRIDQKKYPHPSSFLSIRPKFGIVTSRMSCFGRVNIRKKDLIERSQIFIREFYDRGYPLKEIRSIAGRFLKMNPLQFVVKGLLNNIFKKMIWSMQVYMYAFYLVRI